MILANFDLSFFTTIPGMLITGGVLLLLIALIIFIATGSKGKEKAIDKDIKNEPESVVSPTVPTEPAPVQTTEPVVTNEVPPVVEPPKVAPVTVNENLINGTVTEQAPTKVVEPKVEEVINTPADPVASSAPVTVVPLEPIPDKEEVKPVEEPSLQTPAVEIQNVTPEVKTTPAVEPPVTEEKKEVPQEEAKPIYGGASPVIPTISVNNEPHRQIYGGANPLENTQSVPIINTVVNEDNNKVEKQAEQVVPAPVKEEVKIEEPKAPELPKEPIKQEEVIESLF